MDFAPYQHSYQSVNSLRFFDKADEITDVVFRYKNVWRHHATHQRPRPYRTIPDGANPQYAFLLSESPHIWRCLGNVQHDNFHHFHGWFNPVRVVGTVIFERKTEIRFQDVCDVAAKNQGSLVQLIQGMQEIKLANAEHLKRWEWERIQTKMFQFQTKGLALNQYQQAGAFFLNEGKNILITFFTAKAVVDGQLTLGTMLAVQYIIGQLNAPIESLIQFVQSAQSAKISLERLNEIHELDDESPLTPEGGTFSSGLLSSKSRVLAPPSGAGGAAISIRNLSFTYPGAGNEPVLKNINLEIPQGKVTAIVGMSGSGKTTLLKLLLKFYEFKGDILVNNTPFGSLRASQWRGKCGVVMQDGFIFSDTIARNIALGDENPNIKKLYHACEVANIMEFIESLPLGFNTKIGSEGNGISQGQKQRLLIARAVYKEPDYLFFDEATNALDANNEKKILENLEEFFHGRTVIVVAHRLSTVKNADQIVVLHKGEIIEVGTHESLTVKRGEYFDLVKNQLELGS